MWRSLVAHPLWERGVASSILAIPISSIGRSSNGRTQLFGSCHWGSNPCLPAVFPGSTTVVQRPVKAMVSGSNPDLGVSPE